MASKKEIDKEQFEKLCEIQCTEEEIAYFFSMSPSTLERECQEKYGESFKEVYKKHTHKGKMTLRRYQMQLAEKYPVMAIWLGKQYLGQKDHDEAKEETEGITIEVGGVKKCE